MNLDWQDDAACRARNVSINTFFPPIDHRTSEPLRIASEAAAKAICQTCPVLMECLEYAFDTNQEYGVWGGMGARDRERFKRRMARRRREALVHNRSGYVRGCLCGVCTEGQRNYMAGLRSHGGVAS